MEVGHRSAVRKKEMAACTTRFVNSTACKNSSNRRWDLVTRTEIRCLGSVVVNFYPDVLQAFRDIAAS